ncbi:transporter [Acetobacter fallax]|uniref:Transporter n=1 Tax=Acetobacter fallax TaxID=1737473 RepID=A0ABX0KDG3_9PROT|nr:transporter [Acetobacter fallax]NHO32938.1 transporter [Acetobacter fallax]NHO36559.1 transporter [Acetobacter fallax]
MCLTERPEWLRAIQTLAATGVVALLSTTATRAADINLAIIGPHEYDLPVDFKPFNVFVQYGNGNVADNSYNSLGNRNPGGGSHTWSGLSKYVHFRSFDAIPHVGFAFEVLQAESFTLANGKNFGGLGATIIGPAAWFKPNKHSTFGIQTFVQTPSGTRDALSTGYWANISTFIFDYEWEHFSFDGDAGAIAGVEKHKQGEHTYSPGVIFVTNLRFSWKATKLIEPFFAFDWQNVKGTYDRTISQYVDNSGSREVALGVGIMFNIAKNLSFTARYSHSVEGRNIPESNAYYGKFVYLW